MLPVFRIEHQTMWSFFLIWCHALLRNGMLTFICIFNFWYAPDTECCTRALNIFSDSKQNFKLCQALNLLGFNTFERILKKWEFPIYLFPSHFWLCFNWRHHFFIAAQFQEKMKKGKYPNSASFDIKMTWKSCWLFCKW